MEAKKCLFLAYSSSQKLNRRTVWEQSRYRKKAKKLYLLYILKKLKEEKREKRSIWTRPIFSEEQRITFGCGTTLFLELEEDQSKFFNYFRMTKNLFFELLSLLNEKIEKQHVVRSPISAKIRLTITLRYLASGDSMISLSYAFRVAPQTISRIILETCNAIWDCLAKDFLKVPTEDEWKRKAVEFENQWNFPHCIGALDGKHIIIQAPPNSGSSYYNYKNDHSIILLAIVDANMCFILVDIGAPGRQSDSGVFRNSSIGMGFQHKTLNVPDPSPVNNDLTLPYVLVADEAFALTDYMMRPYPRSGNLNQRQRVFNYRLSRARRVVECAFGLLRGRWRVFAKPLIASDHTIKGIVQAAVCLHNFIISKEIHGSNSGGSYSRLDSQNISSECLTDIRKTGSNAYSRHAADVRERFAEYFDTTGAVPWQWQKIVENDF